MRPGLRTELVRDESDPEFEDNWEETRRLYRLWLHSEGLEVEAGPEHRRRKGFTQEELEAVENSKVRCPAQKRCDAGCVIFPRDRGSQK